MKLPWRKWFAKDWLSEKAIPKATPAARGIWIEALNVMIANDTYSIEGTRGEMAMTLRCKESELSAALPSLKSSGLGDVTLHSNGAVVISCRRLQRESSARENGRIRVANHRKNKSCTEPCNTNVPSVSVSVSVSESSSGGESGGRNVTTQLQAEIGKHFNRKPDDRWAYGEESALVEVCKRPNAESEWLEIVAFRRVASRNDEKVCGSIRSQLEGWQGTLDRARTYKSPGFKPTAKTVPASALLTGIPADPESDARAAAEMRKWREQTGL